MTDTPPYESEDACLEIIRVLFSGYESFYHSIAPEGWAQTEYVRIFHPTPEQKLKEAQRVRANLQRLKKAKDPDSAEDENILSLADFPADDLSSIHEMEEFLMLLGLTIYDIFSDNHDVISPEGKAFHLGSMRGTGDFLADFFEEELAEATRPLDYMDFYLGTRWLEHRADVSPFYRYIFDKLRQRGCDWHYAFPRIHLMKIAKTPAEPNSPESYDPEAAQQQALEQREKDRQADALKQKLDEAYEAERETARYEPPPKIVAAYQAVYGSLPKGFLEGDE